MQRSLLQFLRFLFFPNPGGTTYTESHVIALIAVCAGLILLSFILLFWRRKLQNPVTKKLSRSWSSATFWFGVAGLILIVARVEGIQFVAMRFFWVLWGLGALLFLFFQVRQFRAKHYEILPRQQVVDPRDPYLPKKKH